MSEYLFQLDSNGFRQPANPRAVHMFAGERQIHLPPDYLALIDQSDGYEGTTFSGAYLVLYGIEELLRANQTSDLPADLPGLVIIGGDGGGLGIGLDCRAQPADYVIFDWITLHWDEVLFRGKTLNEVAMYLADDGV